ncbi:MAG: hypothetical protein ACYTGX_15350 [Planctomycetota bacterium]|jgi:hypothetical protein
MRLRAPAAVACAALFALAATGCDRGTSSGAGTAGGLTVGVHGERQGVIVPGPECEPIPLTDRRQPMVVRIIRTYPHGSDFRYDLAYYGLEPGTHNLLAYLRRKDGTPLTGVPPVQVEIVENLPDGQVRPTDLDEAPHPRVGGYTLLLWAGGIAWVAGLLAFLFLYRPRAERGGPAGPKPVTLADRLRPLVEQARGGSLEAPGKAELERLVLGYWAGKLGIASIGSVEALQQLKAHGEAGALLRQLETWLHAPPGRAGDVDLQHLLAPYESIAADAVTPAAAAGAGA